MHNHFSCVDGSWPLGVTAREHASTASCSTPITPCSNSTLRTRYSTSRSAIANSRATSDIAQRTEIYHQAALALNEDVPTIFWWSENMIWGVNKKVQGVQPGANTDIHWNIHEWSLAE